MAITFVGSASGNSVSGASITLTLSAVSGIASGDLVIVVSGCRDRAGNEGRIGNALGFTQDVNQLNSSTHRIRTAYKVYASGTDGSCIIEGSGNAQDAMAAVALVFRGQERGTVLDIASTTATGSSTNPNPPSITPLTANAAIVIMATTPIQDTSPSGAITNYSPTTPINNNATDNNPSTACAAYRILTGGAGSPEDPGAFTSWSTSAWVAVTTAIRERQTTGATFAGAGELSASVSLRQQITASFAGVGNLSADTTVSSGATQWSGAATFGGSGNLSAREGDAYAVVSYAVVQFPAAYAIAATLNGSGTLSVNATVTSASVQYSGEARFNGLGNLSAATVQRMIAAATLAGAGNLSVAARLAQAAFATLSGAGSLSVNATKSKTAAATFNGAGNLSALANSRMQVAATLQGSGNLSVEATVAGAVNQWSGEARFNGAGSLSALANQVHVQSATFTGTGGLLVSARLAQVAFATLNGLGSLSVAVRQSMVAQARFGVIKSSFLLHADGSNGSTNFVDSAGNHPIVANGNAQISTAQSKFGGASVLFDGTGDYLTLDGSSDFVFGTGDFTLDFWIRFNDNTAIQVLVVGGVAAPTIWNLRKEVSNVLTLRVNAATMATTTTALVNNQWYHVAWTRAAGNSRLFVDGVQEGSTWSDTVDYTIGVAYPVIGSGANLIQNFVNGWIDELRVIKGVAAWTSDFTPPTSPYQVGDGSLSVEATVVSVAGTQWSGEARFNGAGSFSVDATKSKTAAVTFQGAGSLQAAVTLRSTIAARFDGTGGLQAAVTVCVAAAATFNGAGQLSVNAIKLVALTPDGDSSIGGWLTEVDGLPLYPSIDEIVPIDVDYIKSSPAPTVDICKISMSNPLTSTLIAPVIVSYRYGKSGSDTAALQVRLMQGASVIMTWQHNNIPSGFTTVDQTLDDAMIANITDWNDLFLEFKSGTITVQMGRATFSGSGAMSSGQSVVQPARATFAGSGAM